MLTAGGLTVLTAALDQSIPTAWAAFAALRHLLSLNPIPLAQADANTALFSQMHGIRRLSALLCPPRPQHRPAHGRAGTVPTTFLL